MSGPYIDIPALQNGKKAKIDGAISPGELIAQRRPINQYSNRFFRHDPRMLRVSRTAVRRNR